MSVWDDFKKFVEGLNPLGSYAAGQLAAGEVARQTAMAGVDSESATVLGTQASQLVPGAEKVGQASDKVTEKVMPVVTWLDEHVYQPTYEAAGFAALLRNSDTYREGDSFADSLSRAWDARKDISLGQVMADNFAETANRLPDWGGLAELNKVDIDIYDKQMRDRVYARTYDESGKRIDAAGNRVESASWIENAWRYMSGGIDFTKQLVLDPLVIGGKGLKAARLAKLDVARTAIVEDAAAFEAAQSRMAAETQAVNRAKYRMAVEEPELQRAKSMLDEMENGVIHQDNVIAELNSVRGASGFKPVRESTSKEMAVAQYRNYVARLEKRMSEHQDVVDRFNALDTPKPKLASGVSQFVNQVVSRQMTWQEIAQHRTIRDFAVDSEFLAKAIEEASRKGEAAVTDVLLLAQMSDPSAFLRLQGQHKSMLAIIDDAQTRMDNLEIEIQRTLAGGSPADLVLAKRLNDNKAKLSQYIADLRAENAYLDTLMRTDNSIVGTLPGMPFSSGRLSPIIEEWRANRAIVKAGLQEGRIKPLGFRNRPDLEFEWTRVQAGPLHRAVYAAQWIGHRLGREKPSGLVTVDGLDYYDGVLELRAYLDDVSAMPASIRSQFMDRYVSASTSLERQAVLDDVEQAVVQATAEKYGIADIKKYDEKTGEDIPLWEILYKDFLKDRAKAVEQFKRDKVFAVDTQGTLITNPVLESELAYSRPMLDVGKLESYFATHMPNRTAAQALANDTRRVFGELVLPVWAKADMLWRADVLIRLGYPQRNILSELLVVSQHDIGLHGMFSAGEVTASAKRFAQNHWAKFQDIGARFQAGIDMLGSEGVSLKGLKSIRTDWTIYEQYVGDILEQLRTQRDSIIKVADELLSDPDAIEMGYRFPKEAVARLDEQIALEERKLGQIADRVRAKGTRFGLQRIRGKQTVTIGPYEFAGVFEGPQGAAARNLVGSGGRTAFDASPFTSALKEMGLDGTGTFRDIHPTDDAYWATLAKIINRDFRGSRTAMMVLSGAKREDILAYLSSPAGQSELKKLNWVEDVLPKPSDAKKRRKAGWPDDVETMYGPDTEMATAEAYRQIMSPIDVLMAQTREENYLDFVETQLVRNYLPNDEMRTLVRERLKTDEFGRGGSEVTSAELRVAAKNAQMNPIHGEVLESRSIWTNPDMRLPAKFGKWLEERFIRGAYRWLGQYPEDAVISHPFADSVYRAKLGEIYSVWKANDIRPTNADVLQAETVARKWAVKQSREFLYRVVRKNGIANSIPLLSPFFQAQYSTFRRVGKLAYRNPDKAARIVYLWNQINTNSVEDEDGQRWLIWRIPPSWYDDKGISAEVPQTVRNAIASQNEFRWRAEAFNLLLAGLRIPNPDVLPGQNESTVDKVSRWATAAQSIFGTGPFIQIAANEIIKNNPALDQKATKVFGVPIPKRNILEVFASPYPSANWWDPLLSGWNRRVASLVNGEGNNDFERTQLVMFQNHLDRIRTGEEEPLFADKLKNNEALWKLASEEASAFLALRLAANLSFAFVPSYEGPLTPYVKLYQQYQTKEGVKAYDKWLADYPDMGFIAISRSKNLSGSSQSTDAVFLRKKWNDSIESAISATGLDRESALMFVQMVTNGEIGSEVLRDPWAGFWQRKRGDRVALTAEEGYVNSQVREGWAAYMEEIDAYNEELKRRGITPASNAAEPYNELRRQAVRDLAVKYPDWYRQKSVLSGRSAAVGFVRAMETMLSDEAFVKSLPEDSFWFDMAGILEERRMMVEAAQNMGLGAPNKKMREIYAMSIAPYLENKTAEYYYNMFIESDDFQEAQPR